MGILPLIWDRFIDRLPSGVSTWLDPQPEKLGSRAIGT